MNGFVNDINGDMFTDPDPLRQPQGSARYVENFRFIHFGGNKYALENIQGSTPFFELNPGYKPITGKQISPLISLIFSTNDSDPFDGSNGELGLVYFTENEFSAQYVPIYNHVDLQFSLSYKIACDFWQENPDKTIVYWWDNNKPPRCLNVLNPALQDNILSGSLQIGESYMVLKGRVNYNGGDYGPAEAGGTVFSAIAGNTYVSFGATIVVKYIDVQLLDLIPQLVTFGQIDYVKTLPSGSLMNGSYFYVFQLQDETGARSNYTMGTRPIALTTGEYIENDVMAYQEYQGDGGKAPGGSNRTDLLTGKGIRIRISGIDTKWEKIRVAYIQSNDYLITGQPVVFYEGLVTGSTMDIDHLTMGGEEITKNDIIIPVEGIERNRTGSIAKNNLFIGNIVRRKEFSWKPTVTATPVVRETLHDITDQLYITDSGSGWTHVSNDTPASVDFDDIPLFGHAIYPNKAYHNHWYKARGGSVTLAAGTYNDGDIWYQNNPTTPIETATLGVGAELVPIIHYRRYGTDPITTNPEQFVIFEVEKEWLDSKGTGSNYYMQSNFRKETYRLGICLIDNWGVPYRPFFASDVVMPDHPDTVDNYHTNDNTPVSDTADLLHVVNTTDCFMYYLRHLGIRLSGIDFNEMLEDFNERYGLSATVSDLPTYFKGFMIVRAPLEGEFVAQGLVYPTWKVTGQVDDVPTVPNSDYITRVYPQAGDAVEDSNAANLQDWIFYAQSAFASGSITIADTERIKQLYELISPDFDLDFNSDMGISESDKLRVVGTYSMPDRTGTGGSRGMGILGIMHTDTRNGYSKFVRNQFGTTSNPTEGDFCNIDARYFVDAAINATTERAGVQQWQFINRSGLWDRLDPNYGVASGSYAAHEYYRTSIGSRRFLIKIDGDESTPAASFEKGLSFNNDQTFLDKHLVTIYRPRDVKYGGTTDSAKASTVYIPCGHYQAFDDDFITYLMGNSGVVDNIDIFSGDAFIGLYDKVRHMTVNSENKYPQPLDMDQMLIPVDAKPVRHGGFSHGAIFPVESKINFLLREGRHLAKDKSYGNSSGQLGNAEPDNDIHPEGIVFPGTNTDYNNPEQLICNDVFSNQIFGGGISGFDARQIINNIFQYRYIWTSEKGNNQRIDYFRRIPVDNFKDLSGRYGQLSALVTKNNQLFYTQDDDIGYIAIGERQMIPNSLGSDIILATGELGTRFDIIGDSFGCQHQFSIVVFNGGIMMIDAKRKVLLHISDVNGDISVRALVRSSLINLAGLGLYNDQPLIGKGILGMFDPANEEVLFSCLGIYPKDERIVDEPCFGFSPETGKLTGIYNYRPTFFFSHGTRLFSALNSGLAEYQSTIQPYTSYTALSSLVVSNNSLYMCILSFSTEGSPTSPASDPTHWIQIAKVHAIHQMWTGDRQRIYGLVRTAKIKLVANPDILLSKHFQNFVWIGPLDDFFTSIAVETEDQTGSDSDLDQNNLGEYERQDNRWLSTVPISTRGDDMVGNRMIIEMTMDNRTVVDGVRQPHLSRNKLIRLISLVTKYIQAT